MNKIEKKLLELFRDEALERIRLTDQNDVLADEVDRLLLENSDLQEEVSEQFYEIERLKKYISDLKKIKMGDATDEILKSCNVPAILRKKITAENSD
ncbi:hypothetical protein [Salinicoccus sp. YB14-2]|uniref:hypothetical protein n=1 Tax=Salinicoccus sp. YB14-2 TaxID=1572701 RepID=UPI00068D3558|nr:hypothetical protein [Salinicoccus sp. YB14-2]